VGHEECEVFRVGTKIPPAESLSAKRRMNELDPVSVREESGFEILPIYETTVDLHDNSRVILLGLVQEILNG
jgi:hypothetical protein